MRAVFNYASSAPRYFGNELAPAKPKTVRALTKAFMKFRAAKLAADPSVDTFFKRGESTARFAYFDE